MLNAHYKPSDEIIAKIKDAAYAYIIENDINKYASMNHSICIDICNEIGIEPTNVNIFSVLPAFRYHFDKFVDEYISIKHQRNDVNDSDKI